MKRTIEIDGKEITFKATARTPLLYKQWVGRDLFIDIQHIQTDKESALDVLGDLAYVMAKQADPSIGDIDEWFDQFGMFSIYMALPQLQDMWSAEMSSSVESKKKGTRTERELTTALFLLRCYQNNIPMSDLDALDVGFVFDMFTESANDSYEYDIVATQEDFDRF